MSEENLPSIVPPGNGFRRVERMPSDEDVLVPGSWWSLKDDEEMTGFPEADILAGRRDAESLRGKALYGPAPDHGLVLMVKEVRLDDGAAHTVVLHPHPLWGRAGDVRMLAGPFMAAMRHEPDGAALRAIEESRMMGRITEITDSMARPASEDEVRQIVDRKRLEQEEKQKRERDRAMREGKSDPDAIDEDRMALVPSALLPSRDVADAERVVKEQILVTEARAEIMKASMKSIKEGMEIVGNFQEEKVAVALAGISQQTDFAKSMMSRVHTMKLWLGEGVGVHPLVDGHGPGPDERIRFMQQLLYLDEELFTENMVGTGFSSDNMGDLGKILSDHPDMVSRILPYERCVAITRVRRQSRDFPVPGNWGEVFDVINRKEQDRLIQILVRDGGRITMISADEETSRAQRLFPSKFEIDSIFTKRGYRETESVDVNHIDYTDKKREHDDRALFYKRFLLLLWGAHERDDVFGNLPKGLNWLTRETHDRFFDFVHDEELGLPDGRPPVRDWIAENNRDIRPGSMVVATWKDLIDHRTAPGAWSNHVHHQQEQVKEPANSIDLVQVQRRGSEMFLTASCVKRYQFDSQETNVKVMISDGAGGPGLNQTEGLICIDHMTGKDVRAYIESRRHRASYLEWLGQSMLALPVIERRERVEAELVARLSRGLKAQDDTVIARLPEVAHEAVLAAGWELPKETADTRLIATARLLAREGDIGVEGALQISVRPGAEIVALFPVPPVLDGAVAEPFLLSKTFAARQGGNMKLKSEQIVPFGSTPNAGEIVVGGRIPKEDVAAAWKAGSKGISTVADREFVIDLLSGAAADRARDRLDYLEDPSGEEVQEVLDEIVTAHRNRSKIKDLSVWTPAGVFTSAPDGSNGTVGIFGFEHHPVYHAWMSGHQDAVETFLRRLYQHPDRQLERFHKFEEAGRNPVRIWSDRKGHREAGEDRLVNFPGEYSPTILSPKDITWHSEKDGDQSISSLGESIRDMLRRDLVASRVTGFFGGRSQEKIDKAFAASEGITVHIQAGLEDRIMDVRGIFGKGRNGPAFDI